MKKACIVTICGGSNFGNRLQNLALQTVLNELGFKTETLRNLAGEVFGKFYRYSLFRRIFQSPFAEFIAKRIIKNARILKKVRFAQFNNEFIHWSKFYAYNKQVSKDLADNYDFFIAGSDQIWNPDIPFNSDVEYLCFAPDDKKIAYAASFGVSSLKDTQTVEIKEKLDGFRHISVRENAGLDILKQCEIPFGKVVLDPTMLLTAETWRKMERRPDFALEEEKYILSYMIWGRDSESRNYINEISKQYGWKVIDIYDPNFIEYYAINPTEFLYLIDHAAFVFTDSFHASVFSILFHKQFAVKNRKGMSSRIYTLTKTLGVERALEWNIANDILKLYWVQLVRESLFDRKEKWMRKTNFACLCWKKQG